jgi:glycosyltransferase involved in cell wall biosynthesis
MNLLHATDFHTQINTGITFAVNELVSQTILKSTPSVSVTVVTAGDIDVAEEAGADYRPVPVSKGVGRIWRHAPQYRTICEQLIREKHIDVVHVHGAWMHPQFAAVQAAHGSGKPIVLTNHGLIQWALRQPDWFGSIKKTLYMRVMRDRLFSKVSVYHAITPLDRDAIRSLVPHSRIEIIPNFIDLTKVSAELRTAPKPDTRPYILFVGRLHRTKGLDVLIKAFARARVPSSWRLVIAGPAVDATYNNQLHRMIASHPLRHQIEVRGPVWDRTAKYDLMRNAWITVVPSYTEAISLVNLESAACSTPTVTTPGTGLFDWADGGGVLVEPSEQPLARALSECALWSEQERTDRGAASRRLVERRYSAAAILPRWLDLYSGLAGSLAHQ